MDDSNAAADCTVSAWCLVSGQLRGLWPGLVHLQTAIGTGVTYSSHAP